MITADRLPVALRLLPDAADLVLEGRAVQQRGQPVVGRHVGELAMLEKRLAVCVFQGVRAGAADDVGAEQREHDVGRGMRWAWCRAGPRCPARRIR